VGVVHKNISDAIKKIRNCLIQAPKKPNKFKNKITDKSGESESGK
jgi:hypothetical protein